MKDYSLNKKEKRYFILSYTIVDNNIIAKLATGEKYVIPYNETNEKLVLSRMEEQAKNTGVLERKIRKVLNKSVGCLVFGVGVLSVDVLLLMGGKLSWLCVGLGCATCVLLATEIVFTNILLNDIKKANYFIAHKKLNKIVRKNKNILLGVSKNAVKQIEQTPVGKTVFDINSIDNYSLSDLKRLRENIERDYEFGFVNDQEIDSDNKVKEKVIKLPK